VKGAPMGAPDGLEAAECATFWGSPCKIAGTPYGCPDGTPGHTFASLRVQASRRARGQVGIGGQAASGYAAAGR